MHDAVAHLGRRVAAVAATVSQLRAEVERQAEAEQKALEQAETGDAFDDGEAATQAEVTAAVAQAVERVAEAEAALLEAREALRAVRP